MLCGRWPVLLQVLAWKEHEAGLEKGVRYVTEADVKREDALKQVCSYDQIYLFIYLCIYTYTYTYVYIYIYIYIRIS